jgi:uncharacterized membrane protein YedE/YeeE
MDHYTLFNPVIGGILIGLASLLGTALSGKIPGISGVFGRLLAPATPDKTWRVVFLLGLIGGAALSFALWHRGAAIFGLGWGLGAGFCPGPSLANLGALRIEALVFVPAMAIGMLLAQRAFKADR